MTISKTEQRDVIFSWWLLRVTYGLLFLLAGADKFLNLTTEWSKYVSPHLLKHLPLGATTFLIVVGLIEIGIGVLIFSNNWVKLGAYLATLWLSLIIMNLLTFTGYLDIVLRDIGLAVGTFVLALLTGILQDLRRNEQIYK